MDISIAGAGVVGYAIGRCFKLFGNNVTFLDIDEKKIQDLREKGFSAYKINDPSSALGEMTFVCVPTPTVNNHQDISYVVNACETICALATSRNIVIKSTILPGTTRGIIYPLIRELRKDIKVYVCPEFLTENNTLYDFLHNKIVIGTNFTLYGNKDYGLELLMELYKPFKAPKIVTEWENSEMIKYASNLALANKVAYWCEIDDICKKLHLDTNLIAETVCMDKRIGTYGIRPFGKGFEGTCLPKDSRAFHTWLMEEDIMDDKIDMFGSMIKLNDYITGSHK